MKRLKKSFILPIAVVGCLILAVILTVGIYWQGNRAQKDTRNAVRNVSILYLSELAERREQVVNSILNNYIDDLKYSVSRIDIKEDTASMENFKAYQARMKNWYGLDRYAFVDNKGVVYTSTGTRNIEEYGIDYKAITEPQISIKNINTDDKKAIIAIPVDNIAVEDITLTVCFMEIDMNKMLESVLSMKHNETTFCNIYTSDGIALTDKVLGGLASEDNLISAMERADYDDGYSFGQLKEEFAKRESGTVSFMYNGINETLYYVPVHGTDWMLTYLIRESVITEQINMISDSTIIRSLVLSILTAVILAGMFILIYIQQKQASKAEVERQVSETRQQEMEEQIALQEELLDQEKKRAEQEKMITALTSDYRCAYYVDLDTDEAICYRRESDAVLPYEPGARFNFSDVLVNYCNKYVAASYRDDFLNYIVPDNIRRALATAKVIALRYLVIRDGKESYEMLRMAGVRRPNDRGDHIVHAVGIGFADIDTDMRDSMHKSEELSEALRSAEDANRAKSGFVSNMSHEIRTPITAILGMNEMIRRESTDKNILSYADNINKAGVSLLGIISDILDFSKIEAGRMELAVVSYSPAVLLNDIFNLIRFRAEAKGLAFNIIADKTIPAGLFGDELRIKQVITNLLTNAVKYTEKGSVSLEIKCTERKDGRVKLTVSVSDTGIGIREDEMDKLFAPFDRLDVSRTRSIEGAGLGLSISRQLLKMMDSELKVESKYNSGSRFYFDLWQDVSDQKEMGTFDPAVQETLHENNRTTGKIFTAPGRRVLIVDDMPMNLQVLTGLLKRTQMIIDTASSGNECIQKIGTSEYDIVFLDYRMPGLDGIDTLRKLKEIYPVKTENLPIIALTASATLGDKDRLISAGFTDYLSKPVNIPEMENMMTKYLGAGAVEEISNEEKQDDSDDILKCISDIPDLDPDSGLEYCGDAEDYLFALRTYADSVNEKADQLESSLKENRIEDFTLIAHSLKSMSKSIGAIALHEKAKELEASGRAGDIETLKKDTPSFLSSYRALGAAVDERIPSDPDL